MQWAAWKCVDVNKMAAGCVHFLSVFEEDLDKVLND